MNRNRFAQKNPLQQPEIGFAKALVWFEKTIKEKKKSARSSLNSFYEDVEWRDLRYMVKDYGVAVACEDILRMCNEELLPELQEHPDQAEELFVATYERHLKIYYSPPIKHIRQRWQEIQSEEGISFEGIRFPQAEYSDYFNQPFDVFVEYYAHELAFSMFLLLLEKTIAAMRAPDPFSFVEGTFELINERHEEWAKNISDETLSQVLEDINSQITGRTYYGLRPGGNQSTLDFTLLVWSNGSASWHIMSGANDRAVVRQYFDGKPFEFGRIDANEIVVNYPPPVVELVLSSLYPLPLYGASLEGKSKARSEGKTVLVNDRTAKRIVKSLAIQYRQAEEFVLYGEAAYKHDLSNDYYTKILSDSLWKNILVAKSEQDESKFEAELERYNAKATPGFYGQLKNWFDQRV